MAGASVRFGTVGAITDATGTFVLDGVAPNGPVRLTASAPGYLERATWVTIPEPGGHVQFDMIQDTQPFSLAFYRQLARNAYDDPDNLATLRQWTTSPSFYFKTTLEDRDEEVPDDVIAQVLAIFEHSVPELSGGKFQVASVETGRESRSMADGWVNVYFFHKVDGAVGRATIGGNSGYIHLTYDPDRDKDPEVLSSIAPCTSEVIAIAEHEITHTMGFWHTEHTGVDFQSVDCSGALRPERVTYHAAAAYSRPRLNRDEDLDPFERTLAALRASPAKAHGPVVSCVKP